MLSNGEVLVAVGQNPSASAISSAELYNPSANTWTYTGGLNTARANAMTVLLDNGEVLVAGGQSSNTGGYLSSAEIYNPSTSTWTATGSLPTACDAATATLLNNGEVLVAGGYNSSVGWLSTSELYNPSTGIWTTEGNMAVSRWYATATLLNTGEVLVAGGGSPYGVTDSELFNPSTGTWTATGSMNTARALATAALLANGQVLVAGGEDPSGNWLTSSELYNPSTGSWTPTTSMNTARTDASMTILANSEVLVAGGEASSGSSISAAEVYQYQVDVSPTITSPTIVTCTYGTPVSTTVATLTDSPVPSIVTYTATGLPNWATLNSSTGVLGGTPTAATTTPLTITLTASNGVDPNAVSTFQLSVNPALLTVSANSESRFYGQANPTLTASYSGFVNGDTPSSLSGTLSLNTTAASGSTVGIYNIIPSGLSSPNYSMSFVNGSLIVTPAPLTISANSESMVYGQALPALTATDAGFVNGDSMSSLTGTLSLDTIATASSSVGSYEIIPSGVSSSNYSISFVNGTLSITQAPLTVSADSKSKVYGQSNPTLTATYTGFVNGDTSSSLSGSLTLNTTATASSGAGSYNVVPSGVSDANYSISFVNGTLTIAQAPLTVSANSESRVYGQANPTLTASYAGFVNGDTVSNLSGTLSLNTTATSISSVGIYNIVPSGLSSPNYSISFLNGSLIVTAAPLTISANSVSMVYGQSLPTLTATDAGFVNGDSSSSLTGTLSLNTMATAGSGVGSYVIIPSGLSSSNYSISFANGTLTIAPAPLTVSADSKSKVYGKSNPTLTASYSGFVDGDTTSNLTGLLALTTAATTGSPAGDYSIAASGLSSNNYNITYVNGTLSVTPAALTVSADSKTKVYGQTNPTLTATFTGFVNGDSINTLSGTLTLNTTATSSSGAGTYPITASGVSSTTQAGDASYNAATPVFQTVQVEKAQTITFKTSTKPVTFGVKPIALSARSSSRLPVVFTVVSGPGTITGNKLTVTGVGTIVIEAQQVGNGIYATAAPVEQTIVVKEAPAQRSVIRTGPDTTAEELDGLFGSERE